MAGCCGQKFHRAEFCSVLFCFKEKGLKLHLHLFILPSKSIKKGRRHKEKTTSCHHHLMKAF